MHKYLKAKARERHIATSLPPRFPYALSSLVTIELPLGDLVKHVVEDAVMKNR